MLPFKRAPSGAPGKNDSTENPSAGRRDFHPSDEAATQESYGSGFLPSPGAGESEARLRLAFRSLGPGAWPPLRYPYRKADA